jgi:hypothetical protein
MQALRQPGYPVLDVRWSYGAGGLEVVIRQVQKAEWGLYTMPALELRVDGHLEQAEVSGRETRLYLPAYARAPAAIEVDPEHRWLLKATVARAP